MAEMAGDGSVDKAVAFDQEHSELVLNVDWWWAVHICLCAIAVVANLIFIITVIHNRYETSSDFFLYSAGAAAEFETLLCQLRIE